MNRIELYNDHFQNFKVYGIPHAQLIIADPPYNLGANAYASNPAWYKDGDNKNGESELAGKEFFDTDKDFRPAEFMHFCSQMLVKEPKQGATDEDVEHVGSKVKMPKFNNDGRMVFNCFDWPRDSITPKVHPTQKPVPLLEEIIRIFTDENDVVIDPCAGSGSTLRAAAQLNRKAYGFEIKKDFFKAAQEQVLKWFEPSVFV